MECESVYQWLMPQEESEDMYEINGAKKGGVIRYTNIFPNQVYFMGCIYTYTELYILFLSIYMNDIPDINTYIQATDLEN